MTGLQALGEEAGLIEWVVSVDTMINRAHQHAAGARRHPETPHTRRSGSRRPRTGRSRGGLSTKVHSTRGHRASRQRRGIPATVPVKADRQANRRKKGSASGRPPTFDSAEYRTRHAVECGIDRHEQHRAFATRYDEPAVRHQATVQITTISTWLRDSSNRTWPHPASSRSA